MHAHLYSEAKARRPKLKTLGAHAHAYHSTCVQRVLVSECLPVRVRGSECGQAQRPRGHWHGAAGRCQNSQKSVPWRICYIQEDPVETTCEVQCLRHPTTILSKLAVLTLMMKALLNP